MSSPSSMMLQLAPVSSTAIQTKQIASAAIDDKSPKIISNPPMRRLSENHAHIPHTLAWSKPIAGLQKEQMEMRTGQALIGKKQQVYGNNCLPSVEHLLSLPQQVSNNNHCKSQLVKLSSSWQSPNKCSLSHTAEHINYILVNHHQFTKSCNAQWCAEDSKTPVDCCVIITIANQKQMLWFTLDSCPVRLDWFLSCYQEDYPWGLSTTIGLVPLDSAHQWSRSSQWADSTNSRLWPWSPHQTTPKLHHKLWIQVSAMGSLKTLFMHQPCWLSLQAILDQNDQWQTSRMRHI